MKPLARRAFTLVELLVVIGIIALLISILLLSLNAARESARVIKCASNLRSIGQGIAIYIADNKGVLPASNYYKGFHWEGTKQEPDSPKDGYVHWSSFIYGDKSKSGTDNAYKQLGGWDALQCPSLPNGGLPPANTYKGNSETFANEVADAIDWQAPRLAYTVNEALCPRGIFQLSFGGRGNVRTYRFVRAGSVKRSADTILAAEIWGTQSVVQTKSLMGGSDPVSASRRPVNGFMGGSVNSDELYKVRYDRSANIVKATVADLDKDPQNNPGGSAECTLNWVGRNHGRKRFDTDGLDARQTDFLYLDGHVQTRHIKETIKDDQWGEKFYTLER